MIVVDSSVWIDHLNDRPNTQVDTLRRMIRRALAEPVIVGDVVLYEVLAGLRNAGEVARIRPLFDAYLLVAMLGFDLVPKAVANYQTLRRRGVTVGTVDMVVGTWCIENGAALLTADRDFDPMAEHLGLRLA